MEHLNCPNCGTENPILLKRIKVATYGSCGTTLMVGDAQIRFAGEQGIMHDAPLLFELGDYVHLGRITTPIIDHARYSYGREFWDEF